MISIWLYVYTNTNKQILSIKLCHFGCFRNKPHLATKFHFNYNETWHACQWHVYKDTWKVSEKLIVYFRHNGPPKYLQRPKIVVSPHFESIWPPSFISIIMKLGTYVTHMPSSRFIKLCAKLRGYESCFSITKFVDHATNATQLIWVQNPENPEIGII